MSWLSDRLGIHVNLRPLAPVAGGVVGGLLGGPAGAALGAGLFKSGDNIAHGDNIGHAIGQGALAAGLTYAGGKLFAPGSSAGASGATSGANPSLVSDGNGGWISTGGQAGGTVAAHAARPSVGHLLSQGAQFVRNNKDALMVAGQAANGLLENQRQNAGLDFQKRMYEDEMTRRRQLAMQLPMILQMMGYQIPGLTGAPGQGATPPAPKGAY